MRAVLCRRFGEPEALAVEDVPSPVPGPRDVLVSVRAAGVNFPDVLTVQNRYQHKPELPYIPGQEFAGVVKAVGAQVTEYAPGDRVVGRHRWGAFAEEAIVSADGRIAKLPDGVDFRTAASFTTTYGTAYHALAKRGNLASGEALLVLGAAGGVGLAAVELGRLMGARVIAAASSPEKLETCRANGAHETIDYSRENLRERVRELTGGKGVDVVCDPVGDRYAEPALRGMAWGGRYLVIGFAGGRIPSLPFNLTLLKGCSVIGVAAGTAAQHDMEGAIGEIRDLMQWIAEGRLKPYVSAAYPLERAAEALRLLADRKARGKVVIEP